MCGLPMSLQIFSFICSRLKCKQGKSYKYHFVNHLYMFYTILVLRQEYKTEYKNIKLFTFQNVALCRIIQMVTSLNKQFFNISHCGKLYVCVFIGHTAPDRRIFLYWSYRKNSKIWDTSNNCHNCPKNRKV